MHTFMYIYVCMYMHTCRHVFNYMHTFFKKYDHMLTNLRTVK